ncbi:hypothetical protein C8J43_10668 [Sphingomonas sp. PP-CE-1G-424]|nr:hypothetical protein C8J43_10668 [Sphingomonas sp. PP-CE-1G-424]
MALLFSDIEAVETLYFANDTDNFCWKSSDKLRCQYCGALDGSVRDHRIVTPGIAREGCLYEFDIQDVEDL